MNKKTYDQAALICLCNAVEKTIQELEFHYKLHPNKSIKEEILLLLRQQLDYSNKIKKLNFNRYFFKHLLCEAKLVATSYQLKKEEKIKCSRTSKHSKLLFATLLSLGLLVNEAMQEYLIKADISFDDINFTPKLGDLLNMETKNYEVSIEPIVGKPLDGYYKINTLTYDKNHISCSKELQTYFEELEKKWKIVPAEVAMIIVHVESKGTWNTNGVISPTNDYGLAQINITNHDYIKKQLGYTTDDIQNDPYKNLDAEFLLLTVIFNYYGYDKDNYDLKQVCGTYNGWTTWEGKEQSLDYVNACIDVYNTNYTKNDDEKLLLLTKD